MLFFSMFTKFQVAYQHRNHQIPAEDILIPFLAIVLISFNNNLSIYDTKLTEYVDK